MIRAPLTFHTPENIYDFLQQNVGRLNMLVKMGQAIITFQNYEHNAFALKKYSCTILKGQPLRLFQYKDGDLYNKPEPMSIEIAEEIAPPILPPMIVQAPMSQTARIVQQAIHINDSSDQLQVITKTHFKQVIQEISGFKPIFTTAKSREKQFLNDSSAQNPKNIKDFYKFTELHLSDLKSHVMGLYKKSRKQIQKHGQKQKCQIDLDPSLQPIEIQNNPIQASKLEPKLFYANKQQSLSVKRLANLNNNQFICTNAIVEKNKSRGKVTVYTVGEEFEVMGATLAQGAYGLCMIDKYLLVGNQQGSISFWNSSQGSISDDQPFQMTNKLGNGPIFDILKVGTISNGFRVAALTVDFRLKLFNLSEDKITEDLSTLFLEDKFTYHQDGRPICIDVLQEGKRIAGGSANRFIVYQMDCYRRSVDIPLKNSILKIKKMKENCFALGGNNNLSFFDPRDIRSSIVCEVNTLQIKSLCPMNDYTVCYGGENGEIGMIDSRNVKTPLWKDNHTHKKGVYDILKMGDHVISGDQRGLLVQWNCVQSK